MIKKEYKNTVIGFNGSGVPLGKRSTEDLIDLGIMAHESGHQRLKDMFENLPSLDELKRRKMKAKEKPLVPAADKKKSK